MHDFKTYEMTYPDGKKALFSACCLCGTVEVRNGDKLHDLCSGKMHKNSTVKVLNMKLIEDHE